MRYPIVDGFRGFFLVFMTLSHASYAFGSQLRRLSYHSVGWADAAHGFVFLSGLVIGMVYVRKYQKGGETALKSAIWRRMRTVYTHTAFLAVLTAVLAMTSAAAAPKLFAGFGDAPLVFMGLSLTLLSGPMFADVLQLYLALMLVTPLALMMIVRGRVLTLAAICLCCWTFAQFGLVDFLMERLQDALGLTRLDLHLGLFFNRLGWQIVYFGGLILGALFSLGRFDPAMFRAPQWRPVAGVCFAASLLFAVYHLAAPHLVPDPPEERGTVSLVFLGNVLADLGLLVWLVVAGRDDPNAVVRFGARVVRGIFTWRPLVFLGQYSLQVYTWHVAVLYLLSSFFPWQGLGFPLREILVLSVIASLFLPAWFTARRRGPRVAPVGTTRQA